MKTHKLKHGLSLLEMLIVVGIIAILATMVISVASRIDNQAKEKKTKSLLALLDSALQEYHDYWKMFPDPNKSPYPTRSAALYEQLSATPGSKQLLKKINDALKKKAPGVDDTLQIYDPWGTPLDYRYILNDHFPLLVSAGPDKTFGTADDISNR